MADREILKKWVSILEFQVDKTKAQDMVLNVRSIATGILALAAAFEAASVGIATALVKTSKPLEELYYMSRRVGASASELERFAFAIEQAGGNADRAKGSLERFAARIRENPSFRQVLQDRFGLSGFYDESKKEVTNGLNTFRKFNEQLRTMQGYEQRFYLGEIGEAFEDMQAMQNPEFLHSLEEAAKKQQAAGINMEHAVQNAKELAEQWRSIQFSLRQIWLRFNEMMTDHLADQFRQIGDWVDQNSKEISDTLISIGKAIWEVARALTTGIVGFWKDNSESLGHIKDDLSYLLGEIGKLTGETDKWKIAIEILAGVLIARLLRPAYELVLGITVLLTRHPVIATIVGMMAAGSMAWGSAADTAAHPEWPRDPETGFGINPNLGGLDEKNKQELQNNPISRGGSWLADKWKNRPKWLGGTGGEAAPSPDVPAGQRVFPVTGQMGDEFGHARSGGGRAHAGIDMRAANGSPVSASIGGEVVMNEPHSGYGNTIDVRGDDGLVYRYAIHEGTPMVAVGTRVKAGQQIGTVGAGHVHHEIMTKAEYSRSKFHGFSLRYGGQMPSGLLDPGKIYGIKTGSTFSRNKVVGTTQSPTEASGSKIPEPKVWNPYQLKKPSPSSGGALDAEKLQRIFEPSSFSRVRGGDASSLEYKQNVNVNLHGSDRGPASKSTDLAGPAPHSRMNANFKSSAE